MVLHTGSSNLNFTHLHATSLDKECANRFANRLYMLLYKLLLYDDFFSARRMLHICFYVPPILAANSRRRVARERTSSASCVANYNGVLSRPGKILLPVRPTHERNLFHRTNYDIGDRNDYRSAFSIHLRNV